MKHLKISMTNLRPNFKLLTVSLGLWGLVACNDNPTATTDSKTILSEDTASSQDSGTSQEEIQSSQEVISSSQVENLSSQDVVSSEEDSSEASSGAFPVKGTFKETDVSLAGTFKIEQLPVGFMLTLSDDFSHDSGPDLFITLVKTDAASLGTYDYNGIADEDKFVLGPQLNTGSGMVSAGISRAIEMKAKELQEYQTVMIQCIKWNHTYGIAAINWDNE